MDVSYRVNAKLLRFHGSQFSIRWMERERQRFLTGRAAVDSAGFSDGADRFLGEACAGKFQLRPTLRYPSLFGVSVALRVEPA